jgi:hypothetical protein
MVIPTDNTMALRQRTKYIKREGTPKYQRKTDNTMARRQRTKDIKGG